jgi:hypothetical protein
MRIRMCPKCGGRNIFGVAGGEIGLSECNDCKFRSVVFPEKEISDSDIKDELQEGSLEK